MNIKIKKVTLFGSVCVPGSKSHTIRALILAALAEGKSEIENPLVGEDCISCAKAILELGATVNFLIDTEKNTEAVVWTVQGAGKKAHLPSNIIDVGNSGSVLYFLSPIAATFKGWSIFTGDKSIRSRPVKHIADLLRQAGAETHISHPNCDSPPLLIKGPIKACTLRTDGRLSQYISGMMMAASLLDGTTTIELTDPKETPYLTMTKHWLEKMNIPVQIRKDFTQISVTGPRTIHGFKATIPSDWEAVAFPLIAALISDSTLIIEQIDMSHTQGDEAIADILRAVGGDIVCNPKTKTLTVRGGTMSQIKETKKGWVQGRLAIDRTDTETEKVAELHINCSGFPDAICAIAVIACFIEGRTFIEDIGVCRHKETDRIKAMTSELSKLGATIEEGTDSLIIHGHAPLCADGTNNPEFSLHGGIIESFHDHRIAMSFACLGLGLPPNEELIVKDIECCAVSFPNFVEVMNSIGANFQYQSNT